MHGQGLLYLSPFWWSLSVAFASFAAKHVGTLLVFAMFQGHILGCPRKLGSKVI